MILDKINSKEDLKDFHSIMLETGVRDGFVTRSLEYFEKMYDAMAPEHLRLYMAYLDGKPIAGTIAILYGDKCWYLYGASSNKHRNVMPNYLLQWEMIKWALENNCNVYDFRGVSGDLDENSPLYGLYRFKKGFNGDFTEFFETSPTEIAGIQCLSVQRNDFHRETSLKYRGIFDRIREMR